MSADRRATATLPGHGGPQLLAEICELVEEGETLGGEALGVSVEVVEGCLELGAANLEGEALGGAQTGPLTVGEEVGRAE